MKKLLARTIDELTLAILSPKFNTSEVFRDQNLSLVDDPLLPVEMIAKTPKPFMKMIKSKGLYDVFSYAFPSSVQSSHIKNNTVFGRYYKLTNRLPKSTVILLHGVHESRHWYQERHALNLIKNGHNCLTLTLPYHIERSLRGCASGSQLLSTNLHGIFRILQQSMKDVMALLNWLTTNGERRIGLMGLDFGGLVAGLVASVTKKFNYLILLSPATSLPQVTRYEKAGNIVDERIRKTGLTRDQFLDLMAPWDLRNHKPLIPTNRIMIFEAIHDRLVPSESVEKLWDAWEKPNIRKYRHGHLSLLASRRVFREISKFLDITFMQRRSADLLK